MTKPSRVLQLGNGIRARACTCLHCAYTWVTHPFRGKGRVPIPRCCAKCKTPNWNKPPAWTWGSGKPRHKPAENSRRNPRGYKLLVKAADQLKQI